MFYRQKKGKERPFFSFTFPILSIGLKIGDKCPVRGSFFLHKTLQIV